MTTIKYLSSLKTVDGTAWNALIADNNPFCRYEFLSALETCDCVGERFGWLPRHIVAYQDKKLVGAIILYEKYNNYGEFVFDHTWHMAYQKHNLDYYPKLVSAIPYTPVTGGRLLASKGKQKIIFPLLIKKAQEYCKTNNFSGLHFLFPKTNHHTYLPSKYWHSRYDCQFHWYNKCYKNFDDFLAQLSSKKRKNIRRERQKIIDEGIKFRKLDGNSATKKDWQDFYLFYKLTFLKKSGVATFSLDFFYTIAKTMAKQILLILSYKDNKCIAGALMFVDDKTLYGRHWGCTENIPYLHFETCLYQGIDYCIDNSIAIFQSGAQGEHKIARGFLPIKTRSFHYLSDNTLQRPIANFCTKEHNYIKDYITTIKEHNPYKEIFT